MQHQLLLLSFKLGVPFPPKVSLYYHQGDQNSLWSRFGHIPPHTGPTKREREQGTLCFPGWKVSLCKKEARSIAYLHPWIYAILRFVANENHLVLHFNRILAVLNSWPHRTGTLVLFNQFTISLDRMLVQYLFKKHNDTISITSVISSNKDSFPLIWAWFNESPQKCCSTSF